MRARNIFPLLLVTALFLGGCASPPEATEEEQIPVETSGQRSALFPVISLGQRERSPRPGQSLGLFTTLFLTQGNFLPAPTALEGFISALSFLGSSTEGTSEAFVLLQELGSLLQTDIADMLNRSTDRPETLDGYIDGLRTIVRHGERKAQELESSRDALKEKERGLKKEVSQTKRAIDDAIRAKEFALAGTHQQAFLEVQKRLAEVEAEREQTEDILDTLEELLQVAKERLQAMEENREVLLAGLRVIEVPGIEDLGILEGKSFGRRRSGGSRGGAFDGLRGL